MLGGANTRYEIVRKIARGGMGEVFLARQLGIGGFSKDVVLKQIHDTFADDPEFVTMFLEEARIAAMLDHPNIVQIYGLGQQDRSHFIVMEYVPGLSVSRLVKRVNGPLPLHIGIQIAADVAAGLQFAHDKTDADGSPLGLVHRDVSPPNILVSTSGSVKITDFGIAKVKWSTTKTRAGVVKGKYSYLAPEQVKGDQADRQSDLYSLGLNLYEMTVGQRAYAKGDQILVLRNVAKGKFPAPEEVVPDFPEELRRVLMKALALDRSERYTQCSELQEDLLELLRVWGVNMTPTKLGQYVQEVVGPVEGAAAPAPAPAPAAEPIPPPVMAESPQEEGTTPNIVPEPEDAFGDQATQIVEMATVNLTASAILDDDDPATGIEAAPTTLQPPPLAAAPPLPVAVSGELSSSYPDLPPPVLPGEVSVDPRAVPQAPPVFDSGEVAVDPRAVPQAPPVFDSGEVAVDFPVSSPTPAGMAVGSPVDYYSDPYEESDASPEQVKAAWANVHATSETAVPRRLPRVLLIGSALLAVLVIGGVVMLVLWGDDPGAASSSGKVVSATVAVPDPEDVTDEDDDDDESEVEAKSEAKSKEKDEEKDKDKDEEKDDPEEGPAVAGAGPDAPAEPAPLSGDEPPSGETPEAVASGDTPPGPEPRTEPLPKEVPAPATKEDAPEPTAEPATVKAAKRRLPKITLSVSTDPPTKVYLGRRLLGTTPVTTKIPKRKATLVLRNRKLSVHTTRKINPKGSRISTHYVLRKGRIAFAFKTPRRVRVDGKFVGTTPRPPLVVYEGSHRVLAVDQKRRWKLMRRVKVKAGKTVWVPRRPR